MDFPLFRSIVDFDCVRGHEAVGPYVTRIRMDESRQGWLLERVQSRVDILMYTEIKDRVKMRLHPVYWGSWVEKED